MTLHLTVQDLMVTTKKGRILLDLPALDIPPGQAVGIRGPSGAGKSTLLFALAGLLETAMGSARWGATDMLALSTSARAAFRAEKMGLIFQDFLLFEELGAQANAALPALFSPRARRAGLRRRAAQHLTRLGLDDTPRRVDSFSGGERQRVAIARALANDAGILLADEPTASLHRAAADRLIDDFADLMRDGTRTLIAVSHDPRLLARMDRILTIADGCVTEQTELHP